jgi:hypothetical protein
MSPGFPPELDSRFGWNAELTIRRPLRLVANPAVRFLVTKQYLQSVEPSKKFPYVVALSRAVNALNSAHSLMMSTADKDTPAAIRDRMNAYFFASAILYESLKLIKRMKSIYGREGIFQDTLQRLLKHRTAQTLERMHLKPARRDVAFHYLPNRFGEAISTTPMTECVFASTAGETKGDLHYTSKTDLTQTAASTSLSNEVLCRWAFAKCVLSRRSSYAATSSRQRPTSFAVRVIPTL